MDNVEAERVLEQHLAKYRSQPYDELRNLMGKVETAEIVGASGTTYQIEVEAFWDDPKRPNQRLRIIGAIDDGGLRAFFPKAGGFLINPDGSFHGEAHDA
jgi:hypothetical protein